MVFSSTVFLFLFLPATIIIYYNPIIRNREFRNIFLLIASLIFYAWGEPVNVLLMIFSILAGFLIGKQIDCSTEKKSRKFWLTIGIILYLSIFFIFKYLTFTLSQIFLFIGKEANIINIVIISGLERTRYTFEHHLFAG